MTNQQPQSVADIIAMMNTQKANAGTKAEFSRQNLLAQFLQKNILRVTVEFCGSGDSGSIEDITIEYTSGTEPDKPDEVLRDEIETFAYAYLEATGVNWYDSDGGQGEIEFDLREVPFRFTANVDVNYTASSTEHSAEEIL